MQNYAKKKKKKVITNINEILQVLNDPYINSVERSYWNKPTSIAKQSYLTDEIKTVGNIIRHYEDHPSIIKIKKNVKSPQNSPCSLLAIKSKRYL